MAAITGKQLSSSTRQPSKREQKENKRMERRVSQRQRASENENQSVIWHLKIELNEMSAKKEQCATLTASWPYMWFNWSEHMESAIRLFVAMLCNKEKNSARKIKHQQRIGQRRAHRSTAYEPLTRIVFYDRRDQSRYNCSLQFTRTI